MGRPKKDGPLRQPMGVTLDPRCLSTVRKFEDRSGATRSAVVDRLIVHGVRTKFNPTDAQKNDPSNLK